MRQNCQKLASVNEALTSWIELKRLVNKLVDNLQMMPQNGQLLSQVIKLVACLLLFLQLKDCMELVAMMKG